MKGGPILNDAHKVIAPLVAATLLVVVVAALSFWTFRQTEVAAEARKQNFTLISHGEGLVSDLTEAENGLRGFALTGDATFLEAYLAVRDDVRRGIETMRPLIRICLLYTSPSPRD